MLDTYFSLSGSKTSTSMGIEELLLNLGRFPSAAFPEGLLRHLQSQGDAIHDSLVQIVRDAIQSAQRGLTVEPGPEFFAMALFVPLAKSTDLPFIELLLTTSTDDFQLPQTEMLESILPRLILNVFRDRDASEMIDWIDQMVDRISEEEFYFVAIPRTITMAVASGYLDRVTAIDAFANKLKKRADARYDLLSESILFELKMLSAQNIEAIESLVRECFDREQIDDQRIDLEWWKNGSIHLGSLKVTWNDPVAELREWNFPFLCDDLEPYNATYRANHESSMPLDGDVKSISSNIEQLRQSSDQNYPREAVESLSLVFPDAYNAIIDLIRDEVARYLKQAEAYRSREESWVGNGAYLGLVLVNANRMPLPVDLLDRILEMTTDDRECLFGDQFWLIVRTVAATPLPNYEFVKDWIWDGSRCNADRREMVDFYLCACYNGVIDRDTAIDALTTGLRRALLEEGELIEPYAQCLTFIAPKSHHEILEEAFESDDFDWSMSKETLRRMMQDPQLTKKKLYELVGPSGFIVGRDLVHRSRNRLQS